jgi:hypothetical protein
MADLKNFWFQVPEQIKMSVNACKIVNLLPPAPRARNLELSYKGPGIFCWLTEDFTNCQLPDARGHEDWILNKAGCHYENVKQKRRAEQRGAKRLTRGLHNYRCSFRLGFYSYTTWKTIVFVHFKQVCLPLSLLRVFLFTLLSWVVLDR